MKKIYNTPGMKVVKLQPTNIIMLSNAGNAKDAGIKTADSRESYWDWDE